MFFKGDRIAAGDGSKSWRIQKLVASSLDEISLDDQRAIFGLGGPKARRSSPVRITLNDKLLPVE